jgi:hypothetical protein
MVGLLGSRSGLFFLLAYERGASAEAFAQVRQLGAADLAMALDFNLVHARRMQREDAFHAFAVADAAYRERLVQAGAAFADDHTRENLDAFLVAFDDFGVDFDGITDVELGVIFAKLFRFNFLLQYLVHKILNSLQ